MESSQNHSDIPRKVLVSSAEVLVKQVIEMAEDRVMARDFQGAEHFLSEALTQVQKLISGAP